VLAAPFGFIDWLHVPKGTRARRIGALHGGGNLVVSLLFVASWSMRDPDRQASIAALSLSVLGLLLNRGVMMIRKRVLFWDPSEKERVEA